MTQIHNAGLTAEEMKQTLIALGDYDEAAADFDVDNWLTQLATKAMRAVDGIGVEQLVVDGVIGEYGTMIQEGEFVSNDDFCIVMGKEQWGMQHIAKRSDHQALCGTRIKHVNVFDLFAHGHLCDRCEEKYVNREVAE